MEVMLAKSLPNSHRVPQPEDATAAGARPSQELFFLMVRRSVMRTAQSSLCRRAPIS